MQVAICEPRGSVDPEGGPLRWNFFAGLKGQQGSGHYNATKFAVEGISEALAPGGRAIRHRGHHRRAGPFRTDFLGRSIALAKNTPKTAGVFRAFRANNDGKQVGNPDKGVKAILKAVDADEPPLHLPLGERAYALARTKIADFTTDIDASGGEGHRLRLSALAGVKTLASNRVAGGA